ncbi:MAG: hypothetical protein ACP5JJ_11870 [Anaerolineae bacterium]
MPKSKRRWLWLGSAVAGTALLVLLAGALARLPQGLLEGGTPVATKTAWGLASPFADPASVHPGMAPHERLEYPPMSDPPTQMERGHAEYWMSCMVCHGDRGQGLTEEWRSVLDPADMNCWQSKCHAPNHPPEGFQIPRTSPLVIGPGALTGYRTAEDLFEYLRADMPWPFPGLFYDWQYWQITAYLLDANGIDQGAQSIEPDEPEACDCEGEADCECERRKDPLGPHNAAEILIIPDLVQTHRTDFETEQIAAVVIVGLFVCAAVVYWLIRAL